MGGYTFYKPMAVLFNFLRGLFILPIEMEHLLRIRIVEFKLEKNLKGAFPGLSSLSHTKGYVDL
jgi:hypothetical protein